MLGLGSKKGSVGMGLFVLVPNKIEIQGQHSVSSAMSSRVPINRLILLILLPVTGQTANKETKKAIKCQWQQNGWKVIKSHVFMVEHPCSVCYNLRVVSSLM